MPYFIHFETESGIAGFAPCGARQPWDQETQRIHLVQAVHAEIERIASQTRRFMPSVPEEQIKSLMFRAVNLQEAQEIHAQLLASPDWKDEGVAASAGDMSAEGQESGLDDYGPFAVRPKAVVGRVRRQGSGVKRAPRPAPV